MVLGQYFDYSRSVETKAAVERLSALAHEHRLAVFRLLVRAGHDGMAAGELASSLSVPPSSLSFHLAQLESAQLVEGVRSGRHIHYRLNADGMRGLLEFLTEDCCRGQPELCGLAAPACAPSTPSRRPRRPTG
jgi:DNA-binding transcriptional ArsR family regulator